MKKILFYVVLFIFSVFITEVILFMISLIWPIYPLHNISFTIPDPRLEYRPNPDYPDHDEKGFRNDRVPAKIDLIVLGDSQTYGSGVSREAAWPQQLQRLGLKNVYNMAFGGYGPVHGFILLDEALQQKPGVIIHAFYSGNDFYDSFHAVYDLNNFDYLKTADSLALGRIKKYNSQQPLEQKIAEVYNYKDKITSVKFLRRLKDFLSQNSRMYRLLREALGMGSRKNVRKPEGLSPFDKNLALKYPQDCLILEGSKFSTIFRPKYRGTSLELQDPRINEGLHICLGAIQQMKKRLDKEGIQFLVVLIPSKELVFETAVNNAMLNTPARACYDSLIRNEKKMWQETREFFQQQNVDFVETLPYLRRQVEEGKQPFPASLNEHLNETGHYGVALCVYDKLMQNQKIYKE